MVQLEMQEKLYNLKSNMYYVFKAKIDLKKEAAITGTTFKISMDLPNIIVESTRKLTNNQIGTATEKIKQLLKNRFKMTNIELEIINIIQ